MKNENMGDEELYLAPETEQFEEQKSHRQTACTVIGKLKVNLRRLEIFFVAESATFRRRKQNISKTKCRPKAMAFYIQVYQYLLSLRLLIIWRRIKRISSTATIAPAVI